MTPCLTHCPICQGQFDWMYGYGRDNRCCCKECHDEFEWRRTLAILGKPYEPDPKRLRAAEALTVRAGMNRHEPFEGPG